MMDETNGRHYWRSRDEREATPAFEEAARHEFAEDVVAPEMDGPTRRHFMGVMGASIAMTSLAGCVRRPEQKILPYAKAPEGTLPGIPSWFATGTSIGGRAIGLLVESHEGRPTKIEGNPGHPSTGLSGGTLAMHQGMVLDLYDPHRLTKPMKGGEAAKWEDVTSFIGEHFAGLKQGRGAELAVLCADLPSPTLLALRERFKATFAGSRWYTFESVSDDNQLAGLRAVFKDGLKPGEALRPHYRLHEADVIVSIDADFLGTEGDAVQDAAMWARRRKVKAPGDRMSRLYAVENYYSVTGTNADHRLRLSNAEVEQFTFGLAAKLAESGQVVLPADLGAAAKGRSAGLSAKAQKFIDAVAADLLKTRDERGVARKPLLIAGRRQAPVVHALVAAINKGLGAQGATLYYFPQPVRQDDAGDMAGLKALADELQAGKVKTLLILGANPVYSAPADLDFAAAMKKAGTRIVLADQHDETAALATLAIPRAHFLEAWGDVYFTDGTTTIQQPLIAPLHGAWSEIELCAQALGDGKTAGYDVVRELWKSKHGAKGFHKAWRRWLHDGRMPEPFFGAFPAYKNVNQVGDLLAGEGPKAPTDKSFEIIFVDDANLFDGRFANNSWLQEAPDPLTKITWDNVALISPATAKRLGIEDEDRVRVFGPNGAELDTAAWILPGLADNTVAVALGYGRQFDAFLPYHDKGMVGFNANALRSHTSPGWQGGARVSKTAGKYPVACVQRYGRQEPGYDYPARPMVRENTLEGFAAKPEFAKSGVIEHGKAPPDAVVLHPPLKTLYGDHDYSKGMQWGMVIDLNLCTGCNACLVACQSENSVPSVGKDQVMRGREMHWIRMDRYFVGDENDPQVVHQPLGCQQCETAPCENVCPVAATVHSPEGLNDMAYNRCIGTRYCANNCPFKVRRFNFYNYTKGQAETIHMQRNPNVTVRFRGVMEKCTYCTQRITRGKRRANEAEAVEQKQKEIAAITPACAQACPTGSIVFGDINDKASRVAQLKAHPRDYGLLTELNIRPRTSYLAKVRNPNPNMAG
ncbi:MAG: TAT-variant-translocated molybdopterin oxidoreductase [Myxococcales bacterium]|nr:TAT-variant-translocated molybdopterin oxidoreductase [Myxococcales bacterium]